ncbi:MAG: sigma-70 family RNA polymerase sigma factor [Clostridia bacterium]|nr:sigma-70 family RNA polymerase sigma factor [Clostridia bacterium]
MSLVIYFEENYHMLLKLAVMMTKDVDLGQDVLHTVIARLLQLEKEGKLSELRNRSAYVATCIRRVTLNHFRSVGRADVEDPTVLTAICVHPEAQIAYEYVEWVVSLEKSLQKFSPEMRKAFIDHYLDDHPIEELSVQLNITANALSQRFKRMRTVLAAKAPDMLKHIEYLLLF